MGEASVDRGVNILRCRGIAIQFFWIVDVQETFIATFATGAGLKSQQTSHEIIFPSQAAYYSTPDHEM